MAILQYTRFENHMDVASPETMRDAEKVSDFFDETPYDDDFEAKLSEANRSIVHREDKVDIADNDGEKEKSDSLVRQEKSSGENTRHDKSDDSADCLSLVEVGGGGDPPNPPDDKYIDFEIELLRDKYSVIKQQPLSDADKASFLDGKYISAITNVDIKLYRIYGGGSTQDGFREGEHPKEYLYLTTEKPTDRMFEKMELALSNKWQGKRKDENGKPVFDKNGKPIIDQPNTREFFSEVIVPKGNIINIGYVAPQDTKGKQKLPGGGIQILVQNKGLKFGKEQRLNFGSTYAEFDKHAKKIERDT